MKMAKAEVNRKILSAPEKIILQRNVEFIEFVETEDKLRPFRCGHCRQVAIFHVQLKCGHILCQECLPIFHLKRCPAKDCHEDVENTVYDTKCLDNEISDFKVLCKYHKGGCDVIISLSDLLLHERNCNFSKHTNEKVEELTKCKEEIRFLKRQFAEFQVQLQPLMTLIKDKSLIQNDEIEDVIKEKVKMESAKERMKLERKLTENVEKYIDNKMEILEQKTETKLLSKYEKDFKNLQEKILKEIKESTVMIEKLARNETSKKLKGEVKNFKKELQKNFFTQNEELKKQLQETSKTFIEGAVEEKCKEIEKKSFNYLLDECKKYSEEIKKELSHDFELKLKENQENERAFALIEIKREVNLKGNEIKSNAIEQLNKDLTKLLENEKCNLEKSLNEKYEAEKRKMENELKTALSSEIHSDTSPLSKRLDVQSPKSLNCSWEIEDFKNKLSNDDLSFESEEVEYLNQWGDEGSSFRTTFNLNDQVENKSCNDFIAIFEPKFCSPIHNPYGQNWTDDYDSPQVDAESFLNCTPHWYSITKNDLSFLRSRWLKNKRISVNVIVEPFDRITALEPRHYGHIIWKIDNFKDALESYQHGRQYSWSEAFYSSEKGYRMKGLLFVGDKVYFILYFLKGPWDKDLPETFHHRTTISLISQKDPRELKDKTISKKSNSTTYDEIYGFTKADLEKYVKNNSLIISMKVEMLILKADIAYDNYSEWSD